MNILTSIFTDDLAIDLGTVNTLIYAPERGVVLNEPSAVAIQKYAGELLAVGTPAYKMIGRAPHDAEVFRPVKHGVIENFEATEKMLVAFIRSVQGNHHKRSHMDVGGGTTNIAIVASAAIVSSTSLRVAGNAMDEAIRDYARARYEMQLGERTAEEL